LRDDRASLPAAPS